MKEKGKRKKEEKNILRNLANLEFVAKCCFLTVSFGHNCLKKGRKYKVRARSFFTSKNKTHSFYTNHSVL